MNDENKQAMVDQKKGAAEEKTQLSEEVLNNLSGGGTPQSTASGPTQSISLTYGQMEWKYSNYNKQN